MKSIIRPCQFYIVAAFPVWKLVSFYVNGTQGLALNLTASPVSLAILVGYAASFLILVNHGISALRCGRSGESIQPLLFAALALVFVWIGTNAAFPTLGLIRSLSGIGAYLLMFYFCWRTGRRSPDRVLTYWRWGFGINLIREMILMLVSQAQASNGIFGRAAPPVWIVTRLYNWITAQSSFLLQVAWLGHIVSTVFIAAGLILFLQTLRTGAPQRAPENMVMHLASAILALFIGSGLSLWIFKSSGMVTILAFSAVIFWNAIRVRQMRLAGLTLWMWASGIALASALISVYRPEWRYSVPNVQLEVLQKLSAGAALISSLLWVLGTWLLVSRLATTSSSTAGSSDSLPARRIPRPIWRSKRVVVMVLSGGLAISVIWLHDHNLAEILSPEPKFEGHTLTYYLQHWYADGYGGRVNPQTMAALREMGTDALPYLLKWIATPARSTQQTDYASRALEAFRILGPTAAPAIPELAKMLGPHGNYAAPALAFIGPAAIPALTNRLLETIAVTSKTPLRSGSGNPRVRFAVQTQTIRALMMMNDDAQPAIPALIFYLQHDRSSDIAQATAALGIIGRRRPEIVVPVLTEMLRGSSGYRLGQTADALASFGTNALASIPLLLVAQQDSNPDVRTRVAVAIKRIAPEREDALAPLIQNLRNSNNTVRQQALWALATLGTNALEALPALARTLRDPDPQVRAEAERCIQRIGVADPAIIAALAANLTNANESISSEAASALNKFAPDSKPAFTALLMAMSHSPGRQLRESAKSGLIAASRQNPSWLIEHLEDSDRGLRCQALSITYDIGVAIPEVVPVLARLLNDSDQEVRTLATNTLQLQSPTTAKALGIKSSWEN